MDKIFEGNDYEAYRFACDCLHPFHVMDVSVEIDERGQWVEFDFEIAEIYSKKSFWNRLKDMIKVARGQEIYQCGFSVREEDRRHLKRLVDMANKKIAGRVQLNKSEEE